MTGLVGVLGARLDLIAPVAGFGLFAFLMPVGTALALILGLIGMLRTRPRQRRGGASQAWGGTVLSTVIIGWVFVLSYGTTDAPPIHDITTNIDDPPTFVAAASEDSRGGGFAYPSGGAGVPDLQRQGYPDLGTLHLDISRQEALWRVRHTAEDMGWDLIQGDDENGQVEFADTTPWFHFVDFVSVRVGPRGPPRPSTCVPCPRSESATWARTRTAFGAFWTGWATPTERLRYRSLLHTFPTSNHRRKPTQGAGAPGEN